MNIALVSGGPRQRRIIGRVPHYQMSIDDLQEPFKLRITSVEVIVGAQVLRLEAITLPKTLMEIPD